jgi:hypothetical protein
MAMSIEWWCCSDTRSEISVNDVRDGVLWPFEIIGGHLVRVWERELFRLCFLV